MKTTKKIFTVIHCDNTGKKKTLEKNCASFFEENRFEFTTPGTPQQNSVIEQGFGILSYCMRTINCACGTT